MLPAQASISRLGFWGSGLRGLEFWGCRGLRCRGLGGLGIGGLMLEVWGFGKRFWIQSLGASDLELGFGFGVEGLGFRVKSLGLSFDASRHCGLQGLQEGSGPLLVVLTGQSLFVKRYLTLGP